MRKAGRADTADEQHGELYHRPAQPRRVQGVQRPRLRGLLRLLAERLQPERVRVVPDQAEHDCGRGQTEYGRPQKRMVHAAFLRDTGKQRGKGDRCQPRSRRAHTDGQPAVRAEPAAHQNRRRDHRAEGIADACDSPRKIIDRKTLCCRKEHEADADQHRRQRAARAVADPPVIPADGKGAEQVCRRADRRNE